MRGTQPYGRFSAQIRIRRSDDLGWGYDYERQIRGSYRCCLISALGGKVNESTVVFWFWVRLCEASALWPGAIGKFESKVPEAVSDDRAQA
jgi:hypothetical protein